MGENKNAPRTNGNPPQKPDIRHDGFTEKREHVPPTTIHIPRPKKSND